MRALGQACVCDYRTNALRRRGRRQSTVWTAAWAARQAWTRMARVAWAAWIDRDTAVLIGRGVGGIY